jgi:4-diphosphocytidyl-2-C-methyl-D-erythritol kinase
LSDASAPGRVLTARAKLNLYLHVLGRRGDGYHELDSLVGFAEIGDRLSVAPADELTLHIEGPFAEALDPKGGNLVLRAARLLQERFAVARGAEIRLDKRLPVAAGLGGGSADAAAALLGLARLWALRAGLDDLLSLASELGADVPVCLAGEPAFIGGIGERLEPAPALPELGVILANPRIPLPTAAVFAAREGAFSKPARWTRPITHPEELIALLQERRNDLTRSALALVPEIGAVLAALGELPGVRLARMSGSGATCFGLTSTPAQAERGAEAMRAREPGWWVIASRLAPAGALPPPSKLG